MSSFFETSTLRTLYLTLVMFGVPKGQYLQAIGTLRALAGPSNTMLEPPQLYTCKYY